METHRDAESASMPVERMRRLHRPPADVANAPSLREWAFSFDVPVSPDALWTIVSDTSRLNRALGLAAMHFEERDGVLHGSNHSLGLVQEWIETPWSWVQGSHLTSLRRYSRGMARSVFAAYQLEPLGAGSSTRFHVYFAWVPRNFFGAILVTLGMGWLVRRYGAVVDALSRAGATPSFPPSIPPMLEPAAAQRLADLTERLRQRDLEPRAIESIVMMVTRGDELDLDRIAPRERARALGVDERALVTACLHATRVGLLEMRWDVVCPHCRGARERVAHLGELPARGQCEACSIVFATSDAKAVEITFRPHPSIRPIEQRFYCSAEPATKRHIVLQLTVAAGESITVTTTLSAGRHRTRIVGVDGHGFLDVFADRAQFETVELSSEQLTAENVTGPSPTLRLVGRESESTTFIVETPAWPDTALRPGYVLSMQGFRDLFSEEYLTADVQLEVGEQTILFTDIVGSTEFYEKRGDPAAFSEVKAHFDTLFAIVDRHRGAVVKTIGDATMAAFSSPLDAVAASERMLQAFDEGVGTQPIRIRVSLHTGSCIAVQLHQGIDFFGGTVNLAAKLQSLAQGGQLVLSKRTYESSGVQALLKEKQAVLEDVQYVSSALGAAVDAKRWQIGAKSER